MQLFEFFSGYQKEARTAVAKNEIGFLRWMYDHYEEKTKDACINIENTN